MITLRVSCLITRYWHHLQEVHVGLLDLGKFAEVNNKHEFKRRTYLSLKKQRDAFLSAGNY